MKEKGTGAERKHHQYLNIELFLNSSYLFVLPVVWYSIFIQIFLSWSMSSFAWTIYIFISIMHKIQIDINNITNFFRKRCLAVQKYRNVQTPLYREYVTIWGQRSLITACEVSCLECGTVLERTFGRGGGRSGKAAQGSEKEHWTVSQQPWLQCSSCKFSK